MQRIRNLVLVGCVLLAGCGFHGIKLGLPGVYRIDIPQGNIVTQEMVDQLKPGMNKRQVRFVMGTPLIIDTFEGERWDYVQSMETKGHKRSQERVSLFFRDDLLVRISGDIAPSEAAQGVATPPPASTPDTGAAAPAPAAAPAAIETTPASGAAPASDQAGPPAE